MNKPTVIVKFDYISINFGNNRRLTKGRSGEKGTGAIPQNVFNEFFRRMTENKCDNYGDEVQKFADDIDTVWPEWNVAPRKFTVGENVKFDFGPRRGGMDVGVVAAVRTTSVSVKFTRIGAVRTAADMLQKYNP